MPAADLPIDAANAALLYTDLVDSTRLGEQLGEAVMQRLWRTHDRAARDLVREWNGIEVGRSDGFLLVFPGAAQALGFAQAYHAALAELHPRLKSRIGLHMGPFELRANQPGDIALGATHYDLSGPALPVVARVMAVASAGQTLLTAPARQALEPHADSGRFICYGHWRLKGLDDPVELFEADHPSAPLAPPPDTAAAYRVTRQRGHWLPRSQIAHNLAPERDAFVGRRADLRSLAQRLAGGCRLVSLVGPGGTGKTRLARHFGLAWLGDWPGGVYFCDLSEAGTPQGLCFAVALALGVPLGKGDPAIQIGHAVAGHRRCLLILDNFEQVVGHAAQTLGHWLDRAPEACFLVTSRERLALPGEDVFAIEPLDPAGEAIELFEIRARAQRPDFVVDPSNRGAIADAVRLLDGLPLAIELAAVRIRVLSPQQLVQRLQDRFRLLAGARGAAARQATLRTTIDWSWDLLAPWEQAALAQCSVFEGGFTLDAAEAVLDLSTWLEAPPVIDTVQALVDKSLLRSWVSRGHGRHDIDEPYFGMYLTIREYAAEKCRALGPAEQQATEQRHGRHYAEFGSATAIEALSLRGGAERRWRLALEIDNLVLACRRAIGRRDWDCATPAYQAIWEVLAFRGPHALGAELGQALATGDGLPPALRARAASTLALSLLPLGRLDEARRWLDQAQALAVALRDRALEADVLSALGRVHRLRGEFEQSRLCLDGALQAHREQGLPLREAGDLIALGLITQEQGRIAEVKPHYDAAIALLRQLGNRSDEARVLNLLGVLHAEQGRLAEAGTHFEQALAICREAEDRVLEGEVLTNLGCLQQDLGQLHEAVGLFEQSLLIHREVGNRRFEGYVLGDLGRLHLQQAEWDDSRHCLEQALAITREHGDRRIEGSELRSLGELFIRTGDDAAARQALADGEQVLRRVGDKYYLAFVLCGRGELEMRASAADVARHTVEEAAALAASIHSGPGSELARRIAALREHLG